VAGRRTCGKVGKVGKVWKVWKVGKVGKVGIRTCHVYIEAL